MAIFRRDDGVQFVLQPYRELLTIKNRSLLKSEIRYLSQTNGDYARLLSQLDGNIEAVFSRDPGYLLGENIWQHFGKPDNLIYCEALAESEQVMVVIVKARSVYLDTKIIASNLREEFASLAASNQPFEIYTYGNVPLAEKGTATKFAFDSAQVKSFVKLKQPVLADLPLDSTLQLQPLPLAIAELGLDKRFPYAVLAIAVLVVVAGLWYWLATPSSGSTQSLVTVDPYQAYRIALTTPDPAAKLQSLNQLMATLYTLPGWTATEIDAANNSFSVIVHSLGGSTTALLQWANQQRFTIDFTSEGAVVMVPVTYPNRTAPATIANMQTILSSLIDDMMLILPGKSVQVTTGQAENLFTKTKLTITINNVAPSVLNLIAQRLSGLPVTLDDYKLTVANGLLSGQLPLTILGN